MTPPRKIIRESCLLMEQASIRNPENPNKKLIYRRGYPRGPTGETYIRVIFWRPEIRIYARYILVHLPFFPTQLISNKCAPGACLDFAYKAVVVSEADHYFSHPDWE